MALPIDIAPNTVASSLRAAFGDIARSLQLSEPALLAMLQGGRTLSQVALAQGLSQQQLLDLVTTALAQRGAVAPAGTSGPAAARAALVASPVEPGASGATPGTAPLGVTAPLGGTAPGNTSLGGTALVGANSGAQASDLTRLAEVLSSARFEVPPGTTLTATLVATHLAEHAVLAQTLPSTVALSTPVPVIIQHQGVLSSSVRQVLSDVADQLGLSQPEMFSALAQGRSLSDIAVAAGMSRAAAEAVIVRALLGRGTTSLWSANRLGADRAAEVMASLRMDLGGAVALSASVAASTYAAYLLRETTQPVPTSRWHPRPLPQREGSPDEQDSSPSQQGDDSHEEQGQDQVPPKLVTLRPDGDWLMLERSRRPSLDERL